MLRTTLLTAAAAAALLTAPAAMAQTAPAAPAQAPAADATPAIANNVIDVLKARGEFTTLLAALDQAQLTDTLASRPASGAT